MAKKPKAKKMQQKAENKEPKEVEGKKTQAALTGVTDGTVNSFDFGGLPERNLKKNLGCG